MSKVYNYNCSLSQERTKPHNSTIFLSFLLGSYQKASFFSVKLLHLPLLFGNYLFFYLLFRYVFKVMYTKLGFFFKNFNFKKKNGVMLWRDEIVLKDIPSISRRSWTLPSPHHLGAKDVAFENVWIQRGCVNKQWKPTARYPRSLWANQPIHSFLVGCLNLCLQGTNVCVGLP